MRARAPLPRVTLEPRRLWSLRLSLGATRWVLYAVALAGVLATARNAIAPPVRHLLVVAPLRKSDASAQWFALRFARAYLAWSSDLSAHQAALAAFLSSADDPDGGLTPAPASSEQVNWVAIAGDRDGGGGERDYTVAADTGRGAIRFLAVAVAPGAGGGEVLARYPALVGDPTPQQAAALDGVALPTLTNRTVAAVLDRALRNYVGSSTENLAADLAPGAVVNPAAPGLSLRSVQRLAVERSGVVLATVIASDAGGNAYTLAYEVSVNELGGRWEITRIAS